MRTGRPKTKAAMSKEDFCLFVARMGSQGRAAKALRITLSTVHRYASGRLVVPSLISERVFTISYRVANPPVALCFQRAFMSHSCSPEQ